MQNKKLKINQLRKTCCTTYKNICTTIKINLSQHEHLQQKKLYSTLNTKNRSYSENKQ